MGEPRSFLDVIGQYGIKREVTPGTHRVSWVVKCECGEELAKNWKMNMPPEKVVQFVKQAGWEVSTKNPPKCSGCIEREKRMKQQTRERPTLVAVATTPAQEPAPQPALEIAQEPAPEPVINPKLMRQIYALLDEHFDEGTRRYQHSYSDARIAKETGASVNFVEKVRREAYGELAEDPELIQLRADVEALHIRIAKTEDAMLTHVAAALEPFRQQAETLKTRLAAFERRNCN